MNIKPLILVADADKQSLLDIEEYLQNMGVSILTTSESDKVLSMVEQHNPSVLILDVFAPQMEGFSICRQIKDSPKHSATPVVFVTSMESIDKKVLELKPLYQPDAIVKKSISKTWLQITVRSMLRIADQYNKLNKSYEDSQKLESLRDNLVRMLAHDMRHPLQSIYGYCAFLDGSISNKVPTQEIAYHIKGRAYRLNQMLQNFLDVSRLESKQLPMFWEKTTIGECLHECVERMKSLALSNEIHLEVVCDKRDHAFKADLMILGRILDNLVNNAIKFSPKGQSVILTGKPAESGKGVEISVRDHGPGIDEEKKDQLFEKFSYIETRNKGKPSVGLGLAFCKMAVNAHGGEIDARNHPNGGSVFTINLPPNPERMSQDSEHDGQKKEKTNAN